MSVFDIGRGTKRQNLIPVQGFEASLPVTVVRGTEDGPNVLITAGIHNQEYVGIETANRLAQELEPSSIRGCVAIVHVCNPTGFFSFAPDVVPEDGKNLNRVFPGRNDGSVSEQLAHNLMNYYFNEASCFIDLHSGGYCEELIPHVYFQAMGDRYLENASKRMAQLVDADYMVRAKEYTGSSFSFAAKLGIPGVLLERGGMAAWSENDVLTYLSDVRRILHRLNVISRSEPQRKVPETIERVDYYSADSDGCWYPASAVGSLIKKGMPLGSIRDFFGRELMCPKAAADCVVLYQAGSLAIRRGDFLAACGDI